LASQLDLSYYLSRLDFSGEAQNLSTVVYIQGWQLIPESLARSGGWGLGFQQLGRHGTDVPASDIIFALVGGYGNVLDGGFTFAKIISEFGVFGLLLIGLYLVIVWRSIRHLRYAAKGIENRACNTFAQCVIVSYLIELFIRGAGYFTGTAILLVASLWLAPATRNPRRFAGAAAGPRSATAG